MIGKFGKNFLLRILLPMAAAIVVSLLYSANAFERLEWLTYDQRMQWFSEDRQLHPDIAVILIDEASLGAMNRLVGRFPWPRSIYADLLDFLALGEPKAVVFDILFSEREVEPGQNATTLSANDARLIDATREAGLVYHAGQIYIDDQVSVQNAMPMPIDFVRRFAWHNTVGFSNANNSYSLPIDGLYAAAKGVGVVGIESDADGIYRRMKLFHLYQNKAFPGLSIAALINQDTPISWLSTTNNIVIGERNIPTGQDESVLINMYRTYERFSFAGLIASKQQINAGDIENILISPEEFRNKIVFIGASAAGLEDAKATPLSTKTPGVLLHAFTASNYLDGSFLRPASALVTLISIFLLAFLTSGVILKYPLLWVEMLLPLILAIIFSLGACWQFKNYLVLDMAAPLAALLLSWLMTVVYLSFTEGKDKRRVRRMLAQYVSPSILAEVVDKYEDLIQARMGRKEHITILFSDVRGFTTISEKLQAEEVVEILNCHFGEMSEVIFKYDGTLDKFIGDAIMAFWGAPIKTADHAIKAVTAAMEMAQRLGRVNEVLRAKSLPPISIGIGLNTGDVILGNIGSERKLDYTVIGDNVNLASRMEGLTSKYGCAVLISESTYKEIASVIPCAMVDIVRVKGKHTSIGIYRPLVLPQASPEQLSDARDIASATQHAFNLYLNREWQAAVEAFEKLPDDSSVQVLLDRCKNFRENSPPEDWDGAFTMTAK